MDRRQMIARLPLMAAAVPYALPAQAGGVPPNPQLDAATAELIAAIIAETETFRNESTSEDDDACGDAVGRAYDAGKAVLALPATLRSHPDFLPAVALVQRRWLIMEGSYTDRHEEDVYLLVDGILEGTRFDNLPMLWHIEGEQFDHRPSDAEFEAARLKAWEGGR